MSLTPEAWKALDRLQRRFPDLDEAWAAVVSVRAGRSVGESALLQMLVGNARTLIDAARPKCERCDGDPGVIYETRTAREEKYGDALVARQYRVDCPDCVDHPGWAA